jgi:hypothetical protein
MSDESMYIRPAERDELFVLLASQESKLKPALTELKRRLEMELYRKYSIEEMERLIQRVHDAQTV